MEPSILLLAVLAYISDVSIYINIKPDVLVREWRGDISYVHHQHVNPVLKNTVTMYFNNAKHDLDLVKINIQQTTYYLGDIFAEML